MILQSRGINLGHYRDYFIAKGMFYGAKMRALSRKFLAATSGAWNIIVTRMHGIPACC